MSEKSGKLQQSTVLFTATFSNNVRATVCVEIGSAVTLMDEKMLDTITKSNSDTLIETLNPPREFNMAANNPDGSKTIITCDRAVTIDTQLHIRHGSALIIRGLRWLVTLQKLGEPLLGRPLLEFLGLDCQKVISAAADRYSGEMDASTLIANQHEVNKGSIGRVMDGVFRADGGADDADLDDNDGWLDLGPEDSSEKERVLMLKLQEAKDNGLTPTGVTELENLLRVFSDVIKLKLNGGPLLESNRLR